MTWRVADWESNFEIAQSRRRPTGRMSWVAMPTRHDSRGYRRLIRGDGGVQHFAAWVAIVQVAARCHLRGVLADDRGIGLTVSDLEAMTDIPAAVFDTAIPVLIDIGWLVVSRSDRAPTGVGEEYDYKTRQDRTDKTEQDRTASSPATPYSTRVGCNEAWGKIPKNRQTGVGRFRQLWATIVGDDGVDPDTITAAIVAYYQSPDGLSNYYRTPHRLLEDRVWEENPAAWERQEGRSTTATIGDADAAFDQAQHKETKV